MQTFDGADSVSITVYTLKPQFQALLRPAARRLHGLGITANQLTFGACAISIALGVWLAATPSRLELFLLLPLWCFVRMALNAIDGLLAREFGQRSALGAYLNELTDPVADAALYLPFAFLQGSSAVLVLLIVFLAVLSELAAVLGIVVSGTRRNDGPMGKSDRALVFGTAGLLLGCGIAPGLWFSWMMAIVALLLGVTIVNRVRRGIAAERI